MYPSRDVVAPSTLAMSRATLGFSAIQTIISFQFIIHNAQCTITMRQPIMHYALCIVHYTLCKVTIFCYNLQMLSVKLSKSRCSFVK